MSEDRALEFLLAFDGRIHHLEQGYWLKFEISRREATPERPHELRYSFTLHAPDGSRLLGFDNAHRVAARGSRYRRSPKQHDHWHRTADDEGRAYRFTTVDQLVADFEAEVMRVLNALGVGRAVIGESDVGDGRSR